MSNTIASNLISRIATLANTIDKDEEGKEQYGFVVEMDENLPIPTPQEYLDNLVGDDEKPTFVLPIWVCQDCEGEPMLHSKQIYADGSERFHGILLSEFPIFTLLLIIAEFKRLHNAE